MFSREIGFSGVYQFLREEVRLFHFSREKTEGTTISLSQKPVPAGGFIDLCRGAKAVTPIGLIVTNNPVSSLHRFENRLVPKGLPI